MSHLEVVPPKPDDDRDWDREFTCDTDAPSHIPAGTYAARVVTAPTVWPYKFSRTETVNRLRLTFQIVEGKYKGTRLDFHCDVKRGGKSKFVRTWTIANGAPPKRGDRMPLRVFKDRLFTVAVADVDRDRLHRKLAPLAVYSKIDTILSRDA